MPNCNDLNHNFVFYKLNQQVTDGLRNTQYTATQDELLLRLHLEG